MTQWRPPDFHTLLPSRFADFFPPRNSLLIEELNWRVSLSSRNFLLDLLSFLGGNLVAWIFRGAPPSAQKTKCHSTDGCPPLCLTCRESCHAGSRSDHSIWLTRIQEGRGFYLTVKTEFQCVFPCFSFFFLMIIIVNKNRRSAI